MPRPDSLDVQPLDLAQRDPLLSYLARRTTDPEVALDLLAETFAQAYASRGRYRGASTTRPRAGCTASPSTSSRSTTAAAAVSGSR